MTERTQLVYRNGRLELFKDNKLRAYVENDILYGIDAEGYAVQIGSVEHRSEVIRKWETWRDDPGRY